MNLLVSRSLLSFRRLHLSAPSRPRTFASSSRIAGPAYLCYNHIPRMVELPAHLSATLTALSRTRPKGKKAALVSSFIPYFGSKHLPILPDEVEDALLHTRDGVPCVQFFTKDTALGALFLEHTKPLAARIARLERDIQAMKEEGKVNNEKRRVARQRQAVVELLLAVEHYLFTTSELFSPDELKYMMNKGIRGRFHNKSTFTTLVRASPSAPSFTDSKSFLDQPEQADYTQLHYDLLAEMNWLGGEQNAYAHEGTSLSAWGIVLRRLKRPEVAPSRYEEMLGKLAGQRPAVQKELLLRVLGGKEDNVENLELPPP